MALAYLALAVASLHALAVPCAAYLARRRTPGYGPAVILAHAVLAGALGGVALSTLLK